MHVHAIFVKNLIRNVIVRQGGTAKHDTEQPKVNHFSITAQPKVFCSFYTKAIWHFEDIIKAGHFVPFNLLKLHELLWNIQETGKFMLSFTL